MMDEDEVDMSITGGVIINTGNNFGVNDHAKVFTGKVKMPVKNRSVKVEQVEELQGKTEESAKREKVVNADPTKDDTLF